MKRFITFILTVFLLMSFSLWAFASDEYEGILASDKTAIDFMEGYWTNGRSDYIYASRGDSALINWQTNLPYPTCNIYILEQGIFKGKSLNADSEIVEENIFSIEILDEDSIRVSSFISGDETVFTRDSFAVDEENLENSYVFKTMSRAITFLDGEWMTENLDYLDVSVTEEGFLQFSTNMPCPTGDTMDFCDGDMCAVTFDETGKKSFEHAYSFDITDRDHITVTCYNDGKTYRFFRTTAEIDPDNITTEYVFSCSPRAYAFLEGEWKGKSGDYFILENDEGNVSWRTSLPLEKHYSYLFANGGLIGVDYSEDGTRNTKGLYQMKVISHDQITVDVISEEKLYILNRVK